MHNSRLHTSKLLAYSPKEIPY